MKLYTLTVSAHVDDLAILDVHLDAGLEVSAELRSIALSILPAHLRKIAGDLEGQAAQAPAVAGQ